MKVKYLFLIISVLFSYQIQSQVTAAFSSNTNSGCPNPLLIIVSDQSSSVTGVIDAWTWQIDGPVGFTSVVSSTNQVSSSLNIPGFYSVSLTVCDDNNVCDTLVQTNFIEVFELPSFSYSISPVIGCVPLEVCIDLDITPGCGTTSSVLFDVNDGIVYSVDSFCHTYNTGGDYFDFIFSTQNSCGCVLTETISDTISIADIPIVNFTADQEFSCTPPLNVAFTNTSIASSSATYLWNVPGLVNNVSTTNLNQSFGIGTFDVELIVTELQGCTDTLTNIDMIVVGNPIADFGSNIVEICEGGNIQFNDSSNGAPTGWLWEILGTPTTYSTQNPLINFPAAGTYDIRLTTSYSGGCQDVVTKIAFVTINSLPINDFTVSDSGSCLIPLNTIFNSNSTNSVTSFWSFPGGSPSTATGNGPINVSYTSPGIYNITVSDTSADGCSSQTTFNNVITVTEYMATIVGDTTEGCMPVTNNFSVTTNFSAPISTYNWTLPGSDIVTSSLATPSAIYNSNACFDVGLIVINNIGCTDTVLESDLICAGTPPIANFDFTPLSTCFEVEEICFTFTGSGADSLFWNFDDGPPQWTGPNGSPCHMYSDDIGDYSPSIIAFSNGCPSDTVTFTDSIEIFGPIAVFTSSFGSCSEWNTFEFTNASVVADSSYWAFGDASVPLGTDTSTLENPIWVYPVIDTITNYSITLKVYNFTTGCEHEVTHIINVFPPNADFASSTTVGCAPEIITFSNISYDIGPSIWDTRWNYDSTYFFGPSGSPATVFTNWNFSVSRQKAYTEPGIYDVIMRNNDSRGCLDTILKSNYITIHGVEGGFSADVLEACVPFTVNFLDTSVAPITYVDSWHWNFGTGDPADTSNIQNPSFLYTEAGYYDVSLIVTDSFGCVNIVTYNNYIYAHDPLASFSLSDPFICSNQSVTITNESLGDSLSYNWQFQNGVPAVFSPTANPPDIDFAIEGNHNLYLEVTDNIGCVDDTTIVLPVFDLIVQASADVNFSACSSPPLLVNFSNNSSNNVDSSSVVWDFGNGVTSSDFSPSVLYSTPGDYIVTLTLSSLSGCMDSMIVDTIVIGGPFGEFENISSNELCICDSATFAIKTVNAINPVFLTGDGQAIVFNPMGIAGDTIFDTLTIAYCTIGDYIPSLSFNQGVCSFNVPSDTIKVDSLIADFSIPNTVYCDTGTVCFTDLSLNELNGSIYVNSWLWDFGDGNSSILQNPCNFYNSPGVYYVCLSVADTFGCSSTFCDSVTIRPNPIAVIAVSDTSICLGNTINYFDSSTFSAGSMLDSVFWNFGTGNSTDTSLSSNPTFTFLNSGFYTVNMDVYDDFGCHSLDSIQNEIYALPIVIASVDTFVCIGDSVQINASGALSYSWLPNTNLTDDSIFNPLSFAINDVDYIVTGVDTNGCSNMDTLEIEVSEIIADFSFTTPCVADSIFFTDLSTNINGNTNAWAWNFNDPVSALDSVSNLQNPSHIYNTSGNYNVSLAVENDKFCSADTVIQVSVSVPPEAIFESDSVCLGDQINFSSLLSFNGSGTIVQTNWDFGTGNPADTSNIPMPTFTYSSPGLFTVCLTVTTYLNCSANVGDTCMTVLIYDLPNVVASLDTFVCIGDSVQLNANGALSYSWSPNIDLTDDSIFNPFSYTTNDIEYFVTGIDTNGCSNIDSLDVTVSNIFANFSYTAPCTADSVFFTDLSNNINGNTNSWSWNFNDPISALDSVSNLQDPMHVFNASGNYDVSLFVENDKFCSADTIIQVSVSISPEAIFESDSVCLGLPVNFSSLLSTNGSGTIVETNWNFGTGNPADTSNLNSPTFTFSAAGLYTVCLTVTSDLTCASNNDDTCLTVLIYDLPNVVASSDTFVCVGDSIQLDATGALNYVWSPNSNLSDDSIFNPFSNTVNDIEYFVVGVDTNGCFNTDSLNVDISDVFADFSFTTPCEADSVFFTDLSTNINGNSNVWSWNFDDSSSGIDSVSFIQNPNHIFNNSGSYDVLLAVENDMFCSADTVIQVSVNIPPEAIFQSDSVCLGLPINLNSLLSTGGSGTIVQSSWNFGTANPADTSNLVSPSFTYLNAGIYTVCLTVTSDLSCVGNSDDTCMTVQIYNLPTTLESVDTVCLGNSSNFIDLTVAGDALVVAEYWNFDQNVGDTLLIAGNNGNTNFTYNTYGTYNVTHIAIDANTCVDSSVVPVVVYDNPVSSFTFSSICLNTDNVFTSTSTDGLDGINSINQYSWDIDEGASFNIGSNIESVDFNNVGIHNVSLIVTDNFGCVDTSSQNVNVMIAPTAQIVIDDNDVCEGDLVTVSGNTSTVGTPGIFYAWDEDFNTGIDNTTASHNFSPTDDVVVMLVVTDDNACSDTAFASVIVHENPVASFTYDNGCIGLPLAINSTSTSAEGSLTNYDWLVDNTPTLSGSSTSYTPLSDGTFNLQLIVENSFNCIDSSIIVTVTVDTSVNITLSGNDTVICAAAEIPLEVSGSADNYIWLPQNIFIDNTSESVLANIETSTTITVTGYSENDYCPEAIETISVIVASAPLIEFTATPNPVFIGLTSEIELDVTPFNANDSVIWDDVPTLNTIYGLNVEASPLENTDYDFTVVYYFDSVRCVIDSFVNIQVLDECDNELIYVPNVFTPNNDGKNDVFGMSGISVSQVTYLRIFDRWGMLMFEVENAEFSNGRMKVAESWDGNKGTGGYCNNGVYVILYEAVCVNGSTITGSGNVTLIR